MSKSFSKLFDDQTVIKSEEAVYDYICYVVLTLFPWKKKWISHALEQGAAYVQNCVM